MGLQEHSWMQRVLRLLGLHSMVPVRDGVERGMLERWCTHLPWNSLLNRRGLTWRSLEDSVRAQAVDQTSAIDLMLDHPTLIKRPVVEIADRLLLGFSAERLAAALLPAEAQGSGS